MFAVAIFVLWNRLRERKPYIGIRNYRLFGSRKISFGFSTSNLLSVDPENFASLMLGSYRDQHFIRC